MPPPAFGLQGWVIPRTYQAGASSVGVRSLVSGGMQCVLPPLALPPALLPSGPDALATADVERSAAVMTQRAIPRPMLRIRTSLPQVRSGARCRRLVVDFNQQS